MLHVWKTLSQYLLLVTSSRKRAVCPLHRIPLRSEDTRQHLVLDELLKQLSERIEIIMTSSAFSSYWWAWGRGVCVCVCVCVCVAALLSCAYGVCARVCVCHCACVRVCVYVHVSVSACLPIHSPDNSQFPHSVTPALFCPIGPFNYIMSFHQSLLQPWYDP